MLQEQQAEATDAEEDGETTGSEEHAFAVGHLQSFSPEPQSREQVDERRKRTKPLSTSRHATAVVLAAPPAAHHTGAAGARRPQYSAAEQSDAFVKCRSASPAVCSSDAMMSADEAEREAIYGIVSLQDAGPTAQAIQGRVQRGAAQRGAAAAAGPAARRAARVQRRCGGEKASSSSDAGSDSGHGSGGARRCAGAATSCNAGAAGVVAAAGAAHGAGAACAAATPAPHVVPAGGGAAPGAPCRLPGAAAGPWQYPCASPYPGMMGMQPGMGMVHPYMPAPWAYLAHPWASRGAMMAPMMAHMPVGAAASGTCLGVPIMAVVPGVPVPPLPHSPTLTSHQQQLAAPPPQGHPLASAKQLLAAAAPAGRTLQAAHTCSASFQASMAVAHSCTGMAAPTPVHAV